MSGTIQGWLLSLLSAALVLGAVEALFPEGPVKPVGELALGLVLLCCLAQPLLRWSPLSLSQEYQQTFSAAQSAAEETTLWEGSYLESVMSQRCGAYIEAKARERGLEVRAEVWCEIEDGLPLPVGARLAGDVQAAERETLTQELCAELGLTPEGVTWEEAES